MNTSPTATTKPQLRTIEGVKIRIHPDPAHGFLFQYPAEAAADVNAFLGDRT